MVEQCEGVARKTIPGLEKYQDQLKKQTSCFGKYRRFCFLVNGGSGMSGDIMDSVDGLYKNFVPCRSGQNVDNDP